MVFTENTIQLVMCLVIHEKHHETSQQPIENRSNDDCPGGGGAAYYSTKTHILHRSIHSDPLPRKYLYTSMPCVCVCVILYTH